MDVIQINLSRRSGSNVFFKEFPAASLDSSGCLKVDPIPFVGTVPRAPKLPRFAPDSNLPADNVQ